LEALERIAGDEYVPTENDIMSLPAPTSGTQKYSLTFGSRNLIIYSNSQNSVDDWICQHNGFHFLFYFVDLCSYDRPTPENSRLTEMRKSLALFNTLANSESLKHTLVVLYFMNLEFFESKLVSSPLKTHFRDYTGGNEVSEAGIYIFGRFKKFLGKNRCLFTWGLVKREDVLESEETRKWFSGCIADGVYLLNNGF
jgi:hypothetical protein